MSNRLTSLPAPCTYTETLQTPRQNLQNIGIVGSLGLFPLVVGFLSFPNDLDMTNSALYFLISSAFSGLCMAAGVRVLWKLWRDIHTTIGEQTISRPSLSGRQVLAWQDVSGVATAGVAVCGIYTKEASVVLPLYLYEDPSAVIALIVNRVNSQRPSSKVKTNSLLASPHEPTLSIKTSPSH